MRRSLVTVAAAATMTVAAAATVAGIEVASYPRWRRWCLTWGATSDEASGALPGDELLTRPQIVTTRAVTIEAAPDAIWPWLVQMGPGRGGAYTFDWIENLFGLNMHSANGILPGLQHVEIGDAQRLGKRGPTLRVAAFDPQSSLVLRADDGNWVWAFVIRPVAGGSRLISRNRIELAGASSLARALYSYVMEPGSLVMERKMLLGIKQRAERRADLVDLAP